MAHRVVHDLEVVQIHEEHAGRGPVALGPGQAVGGPVLEQQAIGQAGQRVVEGPVLQLRLELALRGHVPQGEHQAADRAIAAQVAAPDLDLNAHAVTAGDPHVLVVRGAARVFPHARQRADDVISLAFLHQVPEVGALHADVAEDARGRGSRVPDLPVVADDQDGVRGVLDQGAEVGLAAPADYLLAEHDALDGEGSLLSQDFERRGQVGQGSLLAEHRQDPDERISGGTLLERDRAEQDPVTAGDQFPGQLAERSRGQEQRLRSVEPGQVGLGELRQPIHPWRVVVRGGHGAEPGAVAHHDQCLARRARVEQGDRRASDRGRGLLNGDRRRQGRAGPPDRALTAQGAAVRSRHVPQPREHEQVEDGGEHRDHAVIAIAAGLRLDEQDGRGDQRREHEHGQPDGRRISVLPVTPAGSARTCSDGGPPPPTRRRRPPSRGRRSCRCETTRRAGAGRTTRRTPASRRYRA